MELNNRISQFHKNKITEKAVAVMAFFGEKILEMFMTANFYAFKQKWKGSRIRKAERTGNITEMRWQMESWTSQGEERMECRIRHMIVRYFASEWCMKSLLQKYGKLYERGVFPAFFHSLSHAPQNHRHQPLLILDRCSRGTWLDPMSVTVVRQMTGKFRKVASHYAPEPAFGLFLNLPEGSAPWNPGTSMA